MNSLFQGSLAAAQSSAVIVDPAFASALTLAGQTANALQLTERAGHFSWEAPPTRAAFLETIGRGNDPRLLLVSLLPDQGNDADDALSGLSAEEWITRIHHACAGSEARSRTHIILLATQLCPRTVSRLGRSTSWSSLPHPFAEEDLAAAYQDGVRKLNELCHIAYFTDTIRSEAELMMARTSNMLGVLDRLDDASRKTDGNAGNGGVNGAVSGTLVSLGAARRGGTAGDPSLDQAQMRRWVRALIELSGTRSNYLPGKLFSDPAWDMLLDLAEARLSSKRVSVSSLCIAANVPATTALRRIGDLVAENLATRVRDPEDGRRVFVELTDDAFAQMMAYVASVTNRMPKAPQLAETQAAAHTSEAVAAPLQSRA
ncbi:DNA-binding MarR family transcriptional regulator [Parvibaculum indicum]|uniref:winged helix DNA-binding protein n=1 Tax=Parvibaculum indicum TaxID=562969 RepID=UPI001FE4AAD8|nr:winged helix DNA-binding protein [Parvibaculum indicum]NIJ41504.1 DNA-binding MarR family transcriptional regulator [Parvibaculum indicum]